MKKFLVLGLGVFAFFAVVSMANAQFAVGDRVQTTAHVNVRSTPGGAYLGSAMMGDYGTIVGGPVVAPMGTSTPFTWWNVNYDIGVDGWSVGDYLVKVGNGSSTPSVCGDLNGDGVINVQDVSLIINYAFRGVAIPTGVNADVSGDGVVNVQDVNLIIDAAFRGGPAPTGCLDGSQAMEVANIMIAVTEQLIFIVNSSGTNPVVPALLQQLNTLANQLQGLVLGNNQQVIGTATIALQISNQLLNLSPDNPNFIPLLQQMRAILQQLIELLGGNINQPVVDIKADGSDGPVTVPYNTASMLSWTSTNSISCYGFGNGSSTWGGSLPTSGAQGSGNLTNSTTFTLNCQNSAGVSATDSVTVNVASVPAPIVNVQTENYVPNISPNQVTMGSTGNILASFRLTETTNIEDIRINRLTVFQRVFQSGVKSSFPYLGLYNGATLVGTAGPAIQSITTDPSYYYRFNFSNPVVVPRGGSVTLVLKGDVASFSSAGATDNSFHQFKIAASIDPGNSVPEIVEAYGNTSYTRANVVIGGGVSGQTQVLRSKLNVSATPLGPTNNRSKSAVDDLANLNFTSDSAGGVLLQSVAVTVKGSAPSSQFYSATGVPIKLYDLATGTSYNPTSVSGMTLYFNNVNYAISAGTTKSFAVRLNTMDPYTNPASSSFPQTLSATIESAGHVKYTTAISGGTPNVQIPNSVVPMTINTVSYAVGTYTAPTPTPTPTSGTVTPPPSVPTTVTYQCGDLNKSGAVDVADKILMQSYWTGGVPVPVGVNADLNGDGVAADILDYSALNNYLTRGAAAPTCGVSGSGGTRTITPAAAVLSAMQSQLDAIKNQLINILLKL